MQPYRPERKWPGSVREILGVCMLATLAVGCTPTVQMAAPKEPITVNLNIKIQHEIFVKVDKDVEELFSEKGLF